MRDQMEMPKDLEAAIERVMSWEKQHISIALEDTLTQHLNTTNIRAALIFAKKECDAAESKLEEDESDPNLLTTECDELYGALLNHRLARFSAQKMAFNIKMQEAVTKSLDLVDLDESRENFPQKGAMLSNLAHNASTCSQLAKLVEETQQVDAEILQLRLKYISLTKDIKQKWQILKTDKRPLPATASPECKRMDKMANDRESKLHILVAMLQGLISSSGFHWGAHKYYLTLLKLCDSVLCHGNMEEQDQYLKDLPKQRTLMFDPPKNHDDDGDSDED